MYHQFALVTINEHRNRLGLHSATLAFAWMCGWKRNELGREIVWLVGYLFYEGDEFPLSRQQLDQFDNEWQVVVSAPNVFRLAIYSKTVWTIRPHRSLTFCACHFSSSVCIWLCSCSTSSELATFGDWNGFGRYARLDPIQLGIISSASQPSTPPDVSGIEASDPPLQPSSWSESPRQHI